MTPVHMAPIGLAMPLPTMSKAEPWIGSNIEGTSSAGLMLVVAPLPRPPVSAEARSERMSACRLVATTVSLSAGLVTLTAAMAAAQTRVVQGKIGSTRVSLGGRSIIQQTQQHK